MSSIIGGGGSNNTSNNHNNHQAPINNHLTHHRTFSRRGGREESSSLTTTPTQGYPQRVPHHSHSHHSSQHTHHPRQYSSLPLNSSTASYANQSLRHSSSNLRTVELLKDEENPSFGFNIKGGTDFGVPVHIWRVEDSSLAERVGLKRGTQIVQANGIDFTNISHANALKVLKGRRYLKLLLDTTPIMNPTSGSSSNVKSASSSSMMMGVGVGDSSLHSHLSHSRPSSQPVGGVGNTVSTVSTSIATSPYAWIDSRGNPVGPPTPTQLGLGGMGANKRVIQIDINPGQNLGLMIRGGYEYGLGIYVTGVDPGSVAQRGGLQRGDQILEVNGRAFTSITHDKAVQILKSSRKMTIVANYVGKIPADNPNEGGTSTSGELIDLGGSSTGTSAGKGLTTTSMTDPMHSILMDSTNVSAASAAAVSSLFDDEENEDLLAEEEKLIIQNDQDIDLNYTSTTMGSTSRLFSHQDSIEKSTSIMAMIEEKARTVLTKSEHSRFTFYRLEYQQGFLPIQTFVRILLELLNTAEKYTLLTEVREIIRPCDLISFDELIYNKEANLSTKGKGLLSDPNTNVDLLPLVPVSRPTLTPPNLNQQNVNNNILNNHVGVMRRSPLGVPLGVPTVPSYSLYNETTFTTSSTPENSGGRQLLITHGDTQNVMAKLQQQNKLHGFGSGMDNMPPSNSCVRYKVRVQKRKPILGIAIEGGINTPHRLPRIIDVNTEGSAYGTQLKPGQVLLSVDGRKLDGLTHEEIARCILDSYVDMSKPQIEFVVVESKSSFVQSQHHQPQNTSLITHHHPQSHSLQQHHPPQSSIPPLIPPPPPGGGGGVGVVGLGPQHHHHPQHHPHLAPPPSSSSSMMPGGGGITIANPGG